MRDLTPERLTRLLAMISYFADGRPVPVGEAADHFGISTKELLKDIDTLWLSGAPGYGHAELIDFEATALDEGYIQLRNAQQMEHPLRLSPGEAVTLLAALNSLIARLGETDVLASTRMKLMAAAGEAAHAADSVLIERTSAETHALRNEIARAIENHQQLEITYVSAQDEVTTRIINPISLHAIVDHWRLLAWCHRAEANRQFRLDRIIELTTLDSTFTPSKSPTEPPTMDTSAFEHHVTLTLAPSARWLTEQIPVESVEDHGDSFTVVIASGSLRWLEQVCLRLGDDILAIEAPDLRAAVAQRAGEALKLYAE